MNNKYSDEVIRKVVDQYNNGQPAALLCAEYGVPRSTIYSWLQRHKKLKSSTNTDTSFYDYHNLQRKYNKLEEKLEIIKASECSLIAPLREKLEALEKLYGQYSVHALCDALDVSRGTFYNHIFRRKKVTWYDLRREDIKEQIKIVFDESKQRFGSKKICAILAERGVKTSAAYVTELMREMGLQSIGRHSKRDYKKHAGLTKRQNILQQ